MFKHLVSATLKKTISQKAILGKYSVVDIQKVRFMLLTWKCNLENTFPKIIILMLILLLGLHRESVTTVPYVLEVHSASMCRAVLVTLPHP
jgi:hypothetical protein